MKKPSRIRIRMGADGAPRVSLGEGSANGKGVTKTKRKVVSFHKGRAEPAPEETPKSGRIRLRMR